MIEIMEIIFNDSPPGIYGWLAEARLIDESKGLFTSEFGFRYLKWDKMIAVLGDTQQEAAERLAQSITRVLCDRRRK